MNDYKYILEPYVGPASRHLCPNCQHRTKTFSRYINTETGEHLNPAVGRCNRENNCGYHYTPKQYFQDNPNSFETTQCKPYTKPKPSEPPQKQPSFIPVEVFKASLTTNTGNNFVKFLIDLFGVEVTAQLIGRYFIGTSNHWSGATVFWQIDTQGRVRTGKIMLYSPFTGKRVKKPYSHITWVHKALEMPEFVLQQCLFGEHLLRDKIKPVALVESEKTAIIASVYLPQFLWLSVGSLTNLNAEKCSVLKGRTVILFPDLKGFEKWSSKAKEFSNITGFAVSDLLEQGATKSEKVEGLDLADYLIRYPVADFLLQSEKSESLKTKDFSSPQSIAPPPPPPEPEPILINKPQLFQAMVEALELEQTGFPKSIEQKQPQATKPKSWNREISKLEQYFAAITFPSQPVMLNQSCTLSNIPLFLESHLATVKANNGNRTFLPYLNRLKELRQYLTINTN